MILLAENFSPLLGLLVVVPLALMALGRVAIIFMRQGSSQRPWWGLVIGLFCLFIGGSMLLMFATMGGGAPPFVFLLAALPTLVGIRCLLAWKRTPKRNDQPPIDPRDVF